MMPIFLNKSIITTIELTKLIFPKSSGIKSLAKTTPEKKRINRLDICAIVVH